MKTPLDAALEVIAASPADDLARVKAVALIKGYNARYLSRYTAQGTRILDVERSFRLALANPETRGQSQTFDFAGKIDVLIEENGQSKIVEHKTASDSVDSDSDYWDRLAMDSQCCAYFVAAYEMGKNPQSIVYDVIRKPGLSIRAIPELDAEGQKIVTDAAGQRVYNANGKPRLSPDSKLGYELQSRPETVAEFSDRLEEDVMARPAFYFGFREVARTDDQIVEWIEDVWAQSQQLLYARRKGLWPRNVTACTSMGRCEFFGLCAGHRAVTDYAKKASLHPELDVEPGGRELLTNSRLMAYRRCARLHKLRYEDRLEFPSEESEALAFGTLVHAGLEAWFNQIKFNQNEKETL